MGHRATGAITPAVFWDGFGGAILSGIVAAVVALAVVRLEASHATRLSKRANATAKVEALMDALKLVADFQWSDNTDPHVQTRRDAINELSNFVIFARAAMAPVDKRMRELMQVRWRQLTLCQFYARRISPASAYALGEEFNRCHQDFMRDLERWLEDGTLRSSLPVPIRREITVIPSEYVILGPEPIHGRAGFGWIDILPSDRAVMTEHGPVEPDDHPEIGVWLSPRARRTKSHITAENLARTRSMMAYMSQLAEGPFSSRVSTGTIRERLSDIPPLPPP